MAERILVIRDEIVQTRGQRIGLTRHLASSDPVEPGSA